MRAFASRDAAMEFARRSVRDFFARTPRARLRPRRAFERLRSSAHRVPYSRGFDTSLRCQLRPGDPPDTLRHPYLAPWSVPNVLYALSIGCGAGTIKRSERNAPLLGNWERRLAAEITSSFDQRRISGYGALLTPTTSPAQSLKQGSKRRILSTSTHYR